MKFPDDITLARAKKLLDEGKTCKELAQIFHRSPDTIQVWRRKLGLPQLRPHKCDYTKVDALLIAGKTPQEIHAITGDPVKRIVGRRSNLARAGKVAYQKQFQPSKYNPEEKQVPFIPPQKRLEIALRATARNMNMPLKWIKEVWIHGPAGRSFMETYESLPGGGVA